MTSSVAVLLDFRTFWELRKHWPLLGSVHEKNVIHETLSNVIINNFHSSISPRQPLRHTQPPIQCVSGDLSLGVERQGREADHSPPTSAEVKKTWIYTSTPIRLHGVALSQAQGQLHLIPQNTWQSQA
jgi:hypothetical protein